MRRFILLAAAACLAALVVARADARGAEFPYTARLTREAEIYAGPGHKYYATDRLAAGTEVEVYAADEATGFLAIRPPEQCFSWVPAEHVRIENGEPRVAEVTAPTHSWIGTSVEHIREHKFQVRLPVGELLQVIGERRVQTGDGQQQTWYKIVPPAGEFRWIAPKSIGREEPSDGEAADADAKIELASVNLPGRRNQKRKQEPVREETEDDEAEEEDAEAEVAAALHRRRRGGVPAIPLRDLRDDGSPVDDLHAVRQAQHTTSSSSNGSTAKAKTTGDGFVPRKPRTLEAGGAVASPVPSSTARERSTVSRSDSRGDVRSDVRVARVDRSTSPISRSPALSRPLEISASGLVSSEEVKRQLDAVDVDLSLMLAQPQESWELGRLRARVQDLVDKGETAADRGEARLMLEKIDKIAATFNVNESASTGSVASIGYSAVMREAADPRYDGTGWLKPVLSRTRHVAPYALVDSDGKPICFVTPSPGFRIEGYVNKRVGVYGRRGVVESLNAQHILAERVIDLDKQLR